MRTTAGRVGTTTGVALTLLLSACAGGSGAPGETATPTAAPSSAEPAPSATTSDSPSPAASASEGTEPTAGLGAFTPPGTEATTEGDASGYVVTQVRTGEHDGYDRVVYELAGGEGTPGYRVGYVDRAVEDPSDEVRQVDGDAILQVWIIGTTYPSEGGPQEFSQDLRPTGGDIAHVVRPLTFEAMTQSFIGVDDGPRPYRVLVLADPVRVVVDVQDD
ncbi:AMIN-like domain-containing (lipo)protein [Cellulomonas xiejunii]|uniref:AMIN-like domain-containing protein n=1 Tax=Cellulomonas xiejunii TaxID=2968083 RepID=A0ABY5KRB6_9CELL|nr:hypothetical protein [Cellulomonas xiejunii]MCC2315206.1 hypothetical protein [Cellulomonas xiejunii]MCC2321651.1 hypothetical protein [Cellulomonas xiejunii]UUI72965.1 hypothetical protein NP048_05855 [Cellulomonas xiejunii]